MTTRASEPSATESARGREQSGTESSRQGPLRELVEIARRLTAEIPEEERLAERAQMVAYLDEVAAREPTPQPDD